MLYAHLKVYDVQDGPFSFAYCCLQLIHVCLQEREELEERPKHKEMLHAQYSDPLDCAKHRRLLAKHGYLIATELSEGIVSFTRAHSCCVAWPAYLTPIAARRRSGNLCALSSTFAPNSRAAHATTFRHASACCHHRDQKATATACSRLL